MEQSKQYIKISNLPNHQKLLEKAIDGQLDLFAYIGEAAFFECTIYPEEGMCETAWIKNDFAKISTEALKLVYLNGHQVLPKYCLDIGYKRQYPDNSNWIISQPSEIRLDSLHVLKNDFEALSQDHFAIIYSKGKGRLTGKGIDYQINDDRERVVFEYLLSRKQRSAIHATNKDIVDHNHALEGKNSFPEDKVSKLFRSKRNLKKLNIIKTDEDGNYYLDAEIIES